jgi:hypothetical protein
MLSATFFHSLVQIQSILSFFNTFVVRRNSPLSEVVRNNQYTFFDKVGIEIIILR